MARSPRVVINIPELKRVLAVKGLTARAVCMAATPPIPDADWSASSRGHRPMRLAMAERFASALGVPLEQIATPEAPAVPLLPAAPPVAVGGAL